MKEEESKKIIGLIVKNQREKLSLTQEELSEKINIDQSNLSNIENGKNFPSFTTLCSLIENLNIEPNEFLGFLKFKSNNKDIIDIEISERLKAISISIKLHILEIIKETNKN